MSSIYTRQAASFRNELKQTCAALVGIVQGVLADGELRDREIQFLASWLEQAQAVSGIWPGSVIQAQIAQILQDGVVTEHERSRLVETLVRLVDGGLDEDAIRPVATLAFDELLMVDFPGKTFCFTGDFVFGERAACARAAVVRGGAILPAVSKQLDYLIVGGLGSQEWKHGSFGTKIEKALQLRGTGASVRIVAEDVWAGSLGATPQ